MVEQQQQPDLDMYTRPFQLSIPRTHISAKKRTVEAFALAKAAGIVLVGRNEKSLETAVKAAREVPTLVVPTDISDPKSVETLFAKVKERFGKADVLAHIAGVVNEGLTFKDADPNDYWKRIEINTHGTYNLIHYWIHAFDGEGTIISTTSAAAALAFPGLSSYSIGKLAQIRMTEVLHMERPDLRVFALHLGIVPIEEGRGMLTPSFRSFAKDQLTLPAGVIVYLASDRSDHLRGGYVGVNWDVTEMEEHKDEIVQKQLTRLAFVNAKLGPDGYAWES